MKNYIKMIRTSKKEMEQKVEYKNKESTHIGVRFEGN